MDVSEGKKQNNKNKRKFTVRYLMGSKRIREADEKENEEEEQVREVRVAKKRRRRNWLKRGRGGLHLEKVSLDE